MKAPYVRLIGVSEGEKGDKISNWDIRLTQPNQEFIETAPLHTIEHSLAKFIREQVGGDVDGSTLIDCSPFGCRTGFHAIFWGEKTPQEVATLFTNALKRIIAASESDVPGLQRKECGNYLDHSLPQAQVWSRRILEQGFSIDPFERVLL